MAALKKRNQYLESELTKLQSKDLWGDGESGSPKIFIVRQIVNKNITGVFSTYDEATTQVCGDPLYEILMYGVKS